MKKIIENILKIFTKKILNKYQPKIIGITGSVGKTGTKEMVFSVLVDWFKVRKSEKNFNTEVGVPLTVIGSQGPGRSVINWVKIFLRALRLLIFKDKNYPQILILEMAADEPGDIKYLTQLASCDIGIITAIGPTHLQAFKKIENVLKEKEIIVTHLDKNGVAILNKDDQLVWPLEKKISAKNLTFGFAEDADVKATNFSLLWQPTNAAGEFKGVNFNLHFKGEKELIFLPNILAKQQVYNALTAATVGLALGLNLDQIKQGLKHIKPIPGRMRLLDSIKKTLIIDDTYNSSPAAASMAVDVLGSLTCSGQKWAVLGDMLELGPLSEQAHQELGTRVLNTNIDYLVTVGELGKVIAKSASQAGMNQAYIYSFNTPLEAGKFIQNKIQSGDLLLIKGSQGIRMEKIVKEIMAEPKKAGELLVRQDKTWQ